MVQRIEEFGNYPGKPFKTIAAKAWSEFFNLATESVDVAHWFIEADSGTVRLSARSSSVNESDPRWEGLEPVVMLVEGVLELFDTEPDRDALRKSYREWVEKGILDAFQSARIANKYARFNPHGDAFAIVTATTDWGLTNDELRLLWTSRPRFTVAKIKSPKSARSKKKKR